MVAMAKGCRKYSEQCFTLPSQQRLNKLLSVAGQAPAVALEHCPTGVIDADNVYGLRVYWLTSIPLSAFSSILFFISQFLSLFHTPSVGIAQSI
jgi:hypothetical protein